MMKINIVLLLLLTSFLLSAQQNLSLDEFINGDSFKEQSLENLCPSAVKNSYYCEKDNKILEYSFETGKELKVILDYVNDSILDFGIPEGFAFSPDEKKIMFHFSSDPIFRHSFNAKYIVYDLENKIIVLINDTALIRNTTFSPNGNSVAFVKDNNLFIQDLSTLRIKQITSDGKEGSIINGVPDWVYEEEFSLKEGFQWSPDGNYLAYLRFDESLVPEYTLTYYNENNYPVEKKYKYPKAGESNSIVDIFIYNLKSGKYTKVDRGSNDDIYIPRFCWTKQEGKMAFVKMNRQQNELEIDIASVNNSQIEKVYTEKSKTYIDELPQNYPVFINKDNDFLITSEISGFKDIYLKSSSQKAVASVTKGNFEIESILDFDENTKKIYYLSQEKVGSLCLMRTYLKDSKPEYLSALTGQSTAVFNKDYSKMILSYNNSKQPNVNLLCNSDGSKCDTILNNDALAQQVKKSKVPLMEFMQIPVKDYVLNASIIKPLDFNASKKYPVLFYVYGGPGFQQVTDSWKLNWLNYLVMQGYIVVSVDNRGTKGRGVDFRNVTYSNLGLNEANDQIEVAKYFAKQTYVDAGRIGIYGWSYGGYLSALCLMLGNDIFKTAISVAPPVHWKYYDDVYTERYMGLPTDNATGYESSSILSYTPLMKGKLLLIHGSTDDNVHIQNTMMLMDALIRDNKDVEMFIYPNKNHSITGGNTRLHLYTKMIDFLKKNL